LLFRRIGCVNLDRQLQRKAFTGTRVGHSSSFKLRQSRYSQGLYHV
jgi:hypothetical protein